MIIALGATGAGPATAAKLTDPQIAHIVVTADDLDIANAKQALQKSQNAVRHGDAEVGLVKPEKHKGQESNVEQDHEESPH